MVKSIKLFMGAIVAMSLVSGGAVIAHGEEFYKGKKISSLLGIRQGAHLTLIRGLLPVTLPSTSPEAPPRLSKT